LEFTQSALNDLRYFKKKEQNLILDSIEKNLLEKPLLKTRNRKPLRPNDVSSWELRIDKYRVFFDVESETKKVKVKMVGWKEHNRLIVQGKEFLL